MTVGSIAGAAWADEAADPRRWWMLAHADRTRRRLVADVPRGPPEQLIDREGTLMLTAGDHAQIANLAHAYNHAVDSHDADAWTATFADDGEVVSPFGNPRGRQELHGWISGVMASLTGTRHFTLNEVIDGDGDRATMRSYYFVVGTEDAPPAIGATGSYVDELVKVDGDWRFSRRIHAVDASFGGDQLAG